MTSSLDRLLRPRHIAVLGGSWAHNVIEQCLAIGFSGQLWPVHPTRTDIHGQRCYSRPGELPAPPDAVFIGVNRHTTIELVAELSAMGAGGAVCFASGFDEAAAEDREGPELQQRLLQAAGDMPIVGPNCYGFINYLDGALLWPDQHGGVRCDAGVAIITQSSNIAINLTMQTRGLPLAYVLTVGNQSQQALGDMAAAVLADSRVTALGLHIEGFGDLEAFETMAALAHSLGKAIVVLKAGRSDKARQAMISHTSSLSGSDAAASAYLRRLGIARIDTLSQLLETLKLLHVCGGLQGTQLQSMSCSGGEAGLMGDTEAVFPVSFPALDHQQQTDLRDALGPLVALANPLDYHTFIWGDLAAMTQTFTAMLQRPVDLSLLVLDFPRADRCHNPDWLLAISALKQARDATGARVGVIASLPENLREEIAGPLLEDGIAALCGIDDACAAIEAAAFIGSWKPSDPPLHLCKLSTGASVTLEPAAVRAILDRFELPCPDSITVTRPADIQGILGQLTFPVVLKGQGIAHKTELGAVRVNLQSPEELCVAADDMALTAQPTGYVVETMIDGAVAELLVSVIRDEVHGFVLTLAAGGILTELLCDATQLLLPVKADDILAALASLKIGRVLSGYRGQSAADLDAVVTIVLRLQDLVLELQDHLLELEINPLICRTDDAVIVDALLQIDDTCPLLMPQETDSGE